MAERPWPWLMLGIGAALVLLATVPFAITISHGFIVYDDNLYITDNANVQRGITTQGIGWALTTTDASNWHPVTWMSHMLDCTMFRQGDGTQWAGGHHMVNVCLHAVNTLLLWTVLWRMTGSRWRSALVAALFAVHPFHVESIAWIAERKDLLSTCFGLLAMMCYERWVHRGSVTSYLLMPVWFALSLMSKPMLVTLPFVLLLLDAWPLRRFKPGARVWIIVEKIPLMILSLASCAISIFAQRSGGAVFTLEAMPLGARLGNTVVSYAMYLFRTVWPIDLALLYPLPIGGYWPAWKVVGACLLIVIVTVLVYLHRRNRPALLVGWLWFLGTLVPVIGVVQVGMQSMADRYTYVPLIGLFIMAAWSLPAKPLRAVRFAAAVVGIALIALTILTCVQLRYWRDDITLFGRTLDVTNSNFIAHNNLGHALARANQHAAAMREFAAALSIKSDYAAAHENMGITLMRTGQPAQAIEHFETALRRLPNEPRLVAAQGSALVAVGRFDDAVSVYQNALARDAQAADLRAGLAFALMRQDRIDEAVAEYESALRLKHDDAVIHANYGFALALQGRLDAAIAEFQEALRLDPKFEAAKAYLMTARQQQSQPTSE